MLKNATSRWGGPRPGFGPQPKPPTVARVDLRRWYCVRTGHAADVTADIEIRLCGFDVFAPNIWRPATRARRDARGAVHPARPARIEPLFPRYQFVAFRRHDDWQQIRGLPGVDYILGATPDAPIAVPDQVMDLIRGLCSENGCRYPANVDMHDLDVPEPIEVGAVTRIVAGPMAELTGVCTWSSGQRVRLLLQLLGRGVSVTVSRASVEVLEAA